MRNLLQKVGFLFFIFGCLFFSVLCVYYVQQEISEQDFGLYSGVEFYGENLSKLEERNVKEAVLKEIAPYKHVRYSNINISAKKNHDYFYLVVICISDEFKWQDIYNFTYDPFTSGLTQNNYTLELIPDIERSKAISVALQNEETTNLLKLNNLESIVPIVERVLPETAERFYMPKTLLSVTWKGFEKSPVVVSVMVDMEKEKAVSVQNNALAG